MPEEAKVPDRVRDYAQRTLDPYEVSDSLKPTIDELDLWTCVEDLRDRGYTIVKDAAPPDLLDALREVIHTFSEATEGPATHAHVIWKLPSMI